MDLLRYQVNNLSLKYIEQLKMLVKFANLYNSTMLVFEIEIEIVYCFHWDTLS